MKQEAKGSAASAGSVACTVSPIVRPAGESETAYDAWEPIARAAVERDILDSVDLLLIRALAGRAARLGDVPFKCVIAVLIAAVKSGSMRISLDPEALGNRLESFLRGLYLTPDVESPEVQSLGLAAAAAAADPARQASESTGAFLREAGSGTYAAVLGSSPDAFFPLLRSGGSLYFQKYQAAEAAAGVRLATLLSAPDKEIPAPRAHDLLDKVLRELPLRLPPPQESHGSPGRPMIFDSRQIAALDSFLRKRFLVVSGGPGTGKTSLTANILRLAVRSGIPAARIRLAAPTGRAAQRLAESLRRSLESVVYGNGEPIEDPAVGPAANPIGTPGGIYASEENERALDGGLAALESVTLHRLLRYNPGTGEFHHKRKRPLPADLLIVDEVSMVDIFVLARLLDALEDGASLVLLGDMDQLPSIEAGSVLADLVPVDASGRRSSSLLGDHLAFLEASHRSEAGILNVTRRINAQDGPGAISAMRDAIQPVPAETGNGAPVWPIPFLENGIRTTPGGGCRFVNTAMGAGNPSDESGEPAGNWEICLESWLRFHYTGHVFRQESFPGMTLAAPRSASYAEIVGIMTASPVPAEDDFPSGRGWKSEAPGDQERAAWLAKIRELFAYLDQARILTFTRKGWHGSESINRRIRARLEPVWDPGANRGDNPCFTGSPLMILENDYGKGLFNGDVGIQLRLRNRSIAVFQRPGCYLAFPTTFLPRHESAFAMTVHKSQGSEYDYALVVLPESGNRLLFKETLYTALTRARLFAGIYGREETFLEAVARKVERESGLPDYLSSRLYG